MGEGKLSLEELNILLQDTQKEQVAPRYTTTSKEIPNVLRKQYTQRTIPTKKTFSQVSDNIELEIRVEIGGLEKYLHEIFLLRENSILDLQKPQTEPVDIFVENKLIGKGEVIVSDENFGVRISYLMNEQNKEQQ